MDPEDSVSDECSDDTSDESIDGEEGCFLLTPPPQKAPVLPFDGALLLPGHAFPYPLRVTLESVKEVLSMYVGLPHRRSDIMTSIEQVYDPSFERVYVLCWRVMLPVNYGYVCGKYLHSIRGPAVVRFRKCEGV